MHLMVLCLVLTLNIDYFNKPIELHDSLFGFFYCRVTSYDGYLGLLPYRMKDRVILGVWEGWYFSEELKFARDNGYKIEVFKGYKKFIIPLNIM